MSCRSVEDARWAALPFSLVDTRLCSPRLGCFETRGIREWKQINLEN